MTIMRAGHQVRRGYGVNYGENYRAGVCSEVGPRPRQHWGFAGCSSPTTRPPREMTGGVGGAIPRSCGCA